MKRLNPYLLGLALAFGVGLSLVNATVIFTEPPDLSNVDASPTVLTDPSIGVNSIIGSISLTDRVDIFTFDILPGLVLTDIVLGDAGGVNVSGTFSLFEGSSVTGGTLLGQADVTPANAGQSLIALLGTPFPLQAGSFTSAFSYTSNRVGPFEFAIDLHVGVVPEPSSLALFGIGAVGMAAYSRRKRKKRTQ